MRYSVAEAKNNLPKLIDRALAGEEVTITRRGEPMVRLLPERAGRPMDFDALDRRRVQPAAGPIDSSAAADEMRAEAPY